MKSSVAISLIVCGTVLLTVPYLSNAFAMHQVSETMIAMKSAVNLQADIPGHASTVCLVGGAIMILVGAVAGLRGGRSNPG